MKNIIKEDIRKILFQGQFGDSQSLIDELFRYNQESGVKTLKAIGTELRTIMLQNEWIHEDKLYGILEDKIKQLE